MRFDRYRISVVWITGLVFTILSATAFVVVTSNEQPQDQHRRSTTQRSSVTTMSRSLQENTEDIVASNDDDLVDYDKNDDVVNALCEPKTISIAFCGNSMLYFNDSPRQLELMITISQSNTKVIQDSCLRGGATLSSLFEHGNGMTTKFKTTPAKFQLHDILSSSILPNYVINPICSGNIDNEDEATTNIATKSSSSTSNRDDDHISHYDIGSHTVEQMIQSRSQWDYIVLNDYTQGPARLETRRETKHVLRTKYAPLIVPNQDTTTVIVIQTPAYQKEHIKDSTDLGSFTHFTNLLAEGTNAYVQTLKDAGISNVNIAPVGEAYRYLHNTNRALWNKLYSWDHFHPSPFGTYLQICILYCVIFQTCVPMDTYNDNYWLYSRYMQPIDEDPLPKPSMDEANELRRVACLVTGVKIESMKEDTEISGTTNRSSNDDNNEGDDEIDGSSG